MANLTDALKQLQSLPKYLHEIGGGCKCYVSLVTRETDKDGDWIKREGVEAIISSIESESKEEDLEVEFKASEDVIIPDNIKYKQDIAKWGKSNTGKTNHSKFK
jgi:hypothetical protein